MDLSVLRVPCLSDNYAWLLVDEATRQAAVVDPSEAGPIEAVLHETGATLVAIFNTHHHWDHVGGNLELCAKHAGLTVYGGEVDCGRIPGLGRALSDGDSFSFAGHEVRVLFVPGHTRGHIVYLVNDHLFCGDTLFAAGCGRLFEGTPEEMQHSLARLRDLPDDTWVHCGHEYTRANLAFALTVDGDNPALQRRAGEARQHAELTVPFPLGLDKATNPFLRWDAPALKQATRATDPVEVFAALRARKDVFRG